VKNLVIIDVTRLVGAYFEKRFPTGVDRVTLAYVQHYRTRCRVMLRWRGFSGLFSLVVSKQVIDLLLHWAVANTRPMRRLIAYGVLSSIGNGNARGAILLYTGHSDAELASLWRNIRWHRVRPVFFVHDLIPLTHPEYCREGESERHRLRVLSMLKGAAVIANSEHTRAELSAFAQRHGKSMPAQCVALLAPPEQYASKLIVLHSQATGLPREPYPLTPYFLMLGTIEPRKNHALLLKVWTQMLVDLPFDLVPELVVIGQTGWDCDELQAQLRDAPRFKERVRWIPQCDDADMAIWMRGARALLFPSHVEGFGMPAVEALLASTPVIANDLAVFRESVGEVPEYLPAEDIKSWVDTIVLYAAKNSAQRHAQLQRMQSWEAPTWELHFSRVDAFLDALPADDGHA
jgi:glycosyltransferase involved in cell wall biosynthesis